MSDPQAYDLVPAASAMEAVARGEIDMQVATAKRFPRSVGLVRERILELATQAKEVAESCWYALPRGGKVIEGPSVRLAEIVAASYGNLYAAARHVATDETHCTVEGACWDLENNVRMVVQVKRRITKRDGTRFDDDMVAVTVNAACAIALRNAIFKVVPAALLAGITADIKAVAMGEERTLDELRNALVVAFDGKDVDKSVILAFLGKPRVDDITLEDVTLLRGIYTAITDGDTTAAEAFQLDRQPTAVGAVPASAIKPVAAEPGDAPPGAEKDEPPPVAPEDAAAMQKKADAAVVKLAKAQGLAVPKGYHNYGAKKLRLLALDLTEQMAAPKEE